MRKIIGIGETIFDIIFKNGQPTAAVPGGSAFNCIISLGRAGVPTTFISETGNDIVGRQILDFMEENGVATDRVSVFPESKSPVSLAFLDDDNNANYVFYKDHPKDRLEFDYPEINPGDFVVFGSYYSINPVIRPRFAAFLDYAKHHGAILYYDINFRSSHINEKVKLMANIIENFEYADIVRGSLEDFVNLFGDATADKLYRNEISFYCPQFICTNGHESIELRTRCVSKSYPVKQIATVSTIGAGDNFNAGVLYSLLSHGVDKEGVASLTEAQWDEVIASGQRFAENVCQSVNNYIDYSLAQELRNR